MSEFCGTPSPATFAAGKALELAWEVERLKAQCEGMRLELLSVREECDRLRVELNEARKTRDAAQFRSSEDALEKQKLREQLSIAVSLLRSVPPSQRGPMTEGFLLAHREIAHA